jgi:hypothetical protein
MFSSLYEFVKANKSKLRRFADMLDRINLTDAQKNFLLYYINCDLEIDRLKKLADLEQSSKASDYGATLHRIRALDGAIRATGY